jgi:hypothetical protein
MEQPRDPHSSHRTPYQKDLRSQRPLNYHCLCLALSFLLATRDAHETALEWHMKPSGSASVRNGISLRAEPRSTDSFNKQRSLCNDRTKPQLIGEQPKTDIPVSSNNEYSAEKEYSIQSNKRHKSANLHLFKLQMFKVFWLMMQFMVKTATKHCHIE